MKQKIISEKNLLFAIIFCTLLAVSISLFSISASLPNESGAILYDVDLLSFDSGWHVKINGNNENIITIPNYIKAKKNDVVFMRNDLPGVLNDGTYIAFKSINALIAIYVDDELIYESKNYINRGIFMQTFPAWNFVLLDKAYAGKSITVKLTSSYSYYSGIIPQIIIGTHSETLLFASSQASTNLQLGFSIVVLGLLMFIFSIVSFIGEADSRGSIYLAINIAILGLMLISNVCEPHINSRFYFIDHCIMNFCLRIIPITYSFYLFLKSSTEYKKIFATFFCISLLNFIITTILSMISAVDFNATLHVSYIIMLSVFMAALYSELKSNNSNRKYKFLIAAGVGILCVLASIEMFTHTAYKYNYSISLTAVGALVFSLLQMTAVLISAHDRTIKQLTIQKEYNETKIKLMISQIQPHFIYNALTTIRVMIKCDPEKAYRMIYDFSNYLTYNFNSLEDVPLVPFSEELKHIKTYTAIEMERFYDRLIVQFEIKSDKFSVPPLSIQPFVENAIKHSVCKKVEGGTVIIRTYGTKEEWLIQIIDDGIGFDSEAVMKNRRGIGIRNSSYRLSTLSGAEVDLFSEQGKGTVVTVKIAKKGRKADCENDFG